MNGGHYQLHDINWGTLDHASRAPQLMSYVTTMYECARVHALIVCVCVCVCACVYACVLECVCVCIRIIICIGYA